VVSASAALLDEAVRLCVEARALMRSERLDTTDLYRKIEEREALVAAFAERVKSGKASLTEGQDLDREVNDWALLTIRQLAVLRG
jgi:hypothetical protein